MNYIKELLKIEEIILELNATRRELEVKLLCELMASERGDLLKLDMARIRRESYQDERVNSLLKKKTRVDAV